MGLSVGHNGSKPLVLPTAGRRSDFSEHGSLPAAFDRLGLTEKAKSVEASSFNEAMQLTAALLICSSFSSLLERRHVIGNLTGFQPC